MSKRKSTIDANLGKKEKAIRDLQRAIKAAEMSLQAGHLFTTLHNLQLAVDRLQKDLLIKNRIPCNPTSTPSRRRLKPLKPPGPTAAKPSTQRRTGQSGNASS